MALEAASYSTLRLLLLDRSQVKEDDCRLLGNFRPSLLSLPMSSSEDESILILGMHSSSESTGTQINGAMVEELWKFWKAKLRIDRLVGFLSVIRTSSTSEAQPSVSAMLAPFVWCCFKSLSIVHLWVFKDFFELGTFLFESKRSILFSQKTNKNKEKLWNVKTRGALASKKESIL